MKVSVLVAVYNAEKYLRDCLDSLIGQSYQDLEILCIDDCSTDSSLGIIKDYASKDDRIKCLRMTENSGPARARNYGISHSTGELMTFLDSDDYYSPDAIAKAVAVFNEHDKTDCVLFDSVIVDENDNKTRVNCEDFEVLNGYDAFMMSLDRWRIHGIYMCRTDMYRRYLYDDTCKTYSDDNTTRLHYYISREVRRCSGVYYYRKNTQSITRCLDTSRMNYLRANESLRNHLVKLQVSQDVLSFYERIRWENLVWSYKFYYQNRHAFSSSEREYCKNEMKRVWQTIDLPSVSWKLKLKFGFWPMRPFFSLFLAKEYVYFSIKQLLGIKMYPA